MFGTKKGSPGLKKVHLKIIEAHWGLSGLKRFTRVSSGLTKNCGCSLGLIFFCAKMSPVKFLGHAGAQKGSSLFKKKLSCTPLNPVGVGSRSSPLKFNDRRVWIHIFLVEWFSLCLEWFCRSRRQTDMIPNLGEMVRSIKNVRRKFYPIPLPFYSNG